MIPTIDRSIDRSALTCQDDLYRRAESSRRELRPSSKSKTKTKTKIDASLPSFFQTLHYTTHTFRMCRSTRTRLYMTANRTFFFEANDLPRSITAASFLLLPLRIESSISTHLSQLHTALDRNHEGSNRIESIAAWRSGRFVLFLSESAARRNRSNELHLPITPTIIYSIPFHSNSNSIDSEK
jgi:hypothetical protein